jgi:hypothetical protein
LISDAIGSTVAPAGFDPAPEIFGGDRIFRRFRRSPGWKVDIVDLSYRRGVHNFVDIGLFVSLRVDGFEHHLDGQSLEALSGRRRGYRLITFFGFIRSRRCRLLARRVSSDLAGALAWFDTLSTPQQCLDLLGTPESMSPRPGSPLFLAMQDQLLPLVAAQRS